MKTLLLTLSIVLGTALLASAQQSSGSSKPEIYPQQVSIHHNDAVQHFSRDFRTARTFGQSLNLFSLMGDVNFNNLSAVGLRGNENTAVLSQVGSGNVGIISVIGSNNDTSLSQNGNNLYALLGIDGSGNTLDFSQTGSYNGAAFLLNGNGMDYKASQTDAGMQLMRGGRTSIPFTIRHSGPSTIPIIINHN